MRLTAYFDGSCAPVNPGGTARYGFVVRIDGNPIKSESGLIGTGEGMTNNVAEAAGAEALLNYLLDVHSDVPEIWVYGDSEIVINRLRRKSKGKAKGQYVPYIERALMVAEQISARSTVYFHWVPREQNHEADALSRGGNILLNA